MNQRAMMAGAGMRKGLATGLAFWAIEYSLAFVLPSLFLKGHLFTPADTRFSLLLLAIYGAIGALLGVCCDRCIQFAVTSERRLEAGQYIPFVVLVASLGFHYCYSYAYVGPAPTYSVIGLVTYASLTSVLLVVLYFSRAEKFSWVWNSLFLSLLFLTPPWVAEFLISAPRLGERLWISCLLLALIAIVILLLHSQQEGRRRVILTGTVFAALLLHIGLADQKILEQLPEGKAPSQPGAPNIVLVTLDTVRADHLSLYGYERETAPFLSAFADQATVFDRAYSTGSYTLPSHASLFTGLYSGSHGAHFDPLKNKAGRPLAPGFTTLAELLGAYGYDTLGVASNIAYLGPHFGLSQGFDRYDNRAHVSLFSSGLALFPKSTVARLFSDFFPGEMSALHFRRADEINQSALELLDEQQASNRYGRPFFLFLNYMDAHGPYLPPVPYDSMFPGKASIKPNHFAVITGNVLRTGRELTKRVENHLISQYDGSIAYLDNQLGRLFEELKRKDLFDDSLIIVTSDHGEAFGEQRLMGHGVSVYQNQVHVPLLVKFPRQEKGDRIQHPASLVDIYPTVAALSGAELPAPVQGVDLRQAGSLADRCLISEVYPYGWIEAWTPRLMRTQRALLCGQLKLVASIPGAMELFDLQSDPLEENDLAANQPVESEIMLAQLSKWLKDQKARAETFKMDAATSQRLRSLGYVN